MVSNKWVRLLVEHEHDDLGALLLFDFNDNDLSPFDETVVVVVASVVVVAGPTVAVVVGLIDWHSQTVLTNCGSTSH